MDTWFSSALWPFATLGWPQKTKDLATFYPTDVLSTDRGIINLWVTRMIFSGMEFLGKNPFRDVYIHATVLTREGKRMSKSLGTGIDPIVLIEKYGADATRFGICWQIMTGQDIRFVEDNIIMGKKFCNKLWNASRFVMFQISSQKIFQIPAKSAEFQKQKLNKADETILKSLDKIVNLTDKDLNNFHFGQAARRIYHFFWHDFCDKYIEASKLRIHNPKSKIEKENTEKVLLYVLLTSLKILHPFMPFITEEIYQKISLKDKKMLMIENWPR